MKKITRKTPISKKINIIIILVILLLFVTIGIPSFCMLLTKNNSNEVDYWDGTIASSYNGGNGTEEKPYQISNAKEFAYFQEQINNGNTYKDTYFQLTDNIHLNSGVIEYKKDRIVYTKNSIKYYIKPYTNEYYKDINYTQEEGTINIFSKINDFEGNIDGNNKFIYGLYLTNKEDDLYLFKKISGNINNLYFSNSLIYGNHSVGLIKESTNSIYNNIIFNGYIYTKGLDIVKIYNLDDIEIETNIQTIEVEVEELPEESQVNYTTLKGTFSGESIYINNQLINSNEFEIIFDEIIENIIIETDSLNTTITNLTYEINYNKNNNIASIIKETNNTEINNSFITGYIYGKNITSSLIGEANGETRITNSYTDALVQGENISTGMIGKINNSNVIINNCYNNGNITSNNISSGIVGFILEDSNLSINNTFNSGEITGNIKGSLIASTATEIEYSNNYYINENINSIGNSETEIASQKNISELLQSEFLINELSYSEDIWNINDNKLPKLISFDNEAPNIDIKLLNHTWSEINTDNIKIHETGKLNVEYSDNHSDILKVEYHIANKIYTKEEIDELDFELYEDDICLDNNGNYYIIFKTTDVIGNERIATTPLINIDGYDLKINDIYGNSLEKYNNQISINSSIKYNFRKTYQMDNFIYNENTIHMLESDNQIPDNTVIKLIDKINEKIYTYNVNNENVNTIDDKYVYELSLFKEIGKENNIYFDKKVIDYYENNILDENFDIILNFENANITKNTEISLNLITMYNDTKESTTYSNKNNKFILAKYDDNNKETNYTFDLTTDYKDYIDMSEISSYEINLMHNIENSKLNNTDIYNELNNTDKLYLLVNILDSKNKLVKGNLINSLSIDYNENIYYSNNNGYIKIPIIDNNINLSLNVNYLIKDINNGIYYLKISTCNKQSSCSEEVTIPINVLNKTSDINCLFSVEMDAKDRLLLKNSGQTLNNSNNVKVNINYDGNLLEPNVRIKLYKKMNFDSNNQVYELIDLNQYISNNLEKATDYQYYLSKQIENNIETNINLKINNFQYSGYKLVFELYDGDTFIKEDIKTFIVK